MRPLTYGWLALALGGACAAISWLGLAGWLGVVVLAASVAMHVAGNAIGTGLRDAADRRLERVPRRSPDDLPRPAPTHLERHTSLGRLVPVSACIGGLCGGAAGATALTIWATASLPGAILGGLSSAVIGGLLGFLAASFIEILRTTLREALAAEREG
jgi:hypothetical protein